MTTFADMQAQVNIYTKRPELVELTNTAIRMATLRAHQVDFFSRDQANIPLTYTPYTSGQIFVDIPNIYTLTSNLRTPNSLQSLDATSLIPVEFLEYVDDYKNFWDNEGCLKRSVYTLLGNTLRIRSITNTGKLQFYYFQNPVVAGPIAYASWIADLYKEDLAMWAAAIVWMRSGYQEIAQQVNITQIEAFKQMLVESHLTVKI